MNWRTSDTNDKSRQDRLGIAMIIAVVVVVFAGLYVRNQVQSEFVSRGENLCPIEGPLTRETVLLIDATDSFTKSHRETVMNYIRQILVNSELDEKFTLYSLNDEPNSFQPLFSVCNPGDGQDRSRWTENIRRLAEDWENKFLANITTAVENIFIGPTAENSPIMEMFKFVGIRSMFESTAPAKRIVAVSDMVEHTSNYSQYTDSLNFSDFVNNPYFREVRPRLNDVDVEILYIQRPELNAIQRRRHITFWESFIREAGGRVTRCVSIN